MIDIQQGSAVKALIFKMYETGKTTGKTGLSPAVTLSKNGGVGASPAGAISEIDATGMPGWYKVAPNATDSNTKGTLGLYATAAGADPADMAYNIVGYDPDAVAVGAVMPATPGHQLLVDASGLVDIVQGAADKVWGSTTRLLTAGTNIVLPSNGLANVTTWTVAITGSLSGSVGSVTGAIVLPAVPTDWFSAAAVSAAAVSKIQSGLSTYAGGDTSGTTTLLGRLSSARAGLLDNLDVGGVVASHADVLAINMSATKHLLLQTVGQYERPESGTTVYTVEARTFAAATGAAVNADSSPTLTATGQTSGSLTGKIGGITNPATGVYRWTYTVSSTDANEPIRFDVSATIASATFTLSAFSQVVDEVAVTWTATNASNLTAIFNKLPTNGMADESLVIAATDAIMSRLGVNGAGLTALGDSRLGFLDASVASRSTLAAGAAMTLTTGERDAVTAVVERGGGTLALVKAFTDGLVNTGGKLWVLNESGNAIAAGVRTELAVELGRIDATVTSRMATFALPTRFSTLAIAVDGSVTAGALPNPAPTGYGGTFSGDISGMTDEQANELSTIYRRALAPGGLVVISPVLVGGAVRIMRGDDYAADDGRALEFADESWPVLTGATQVLFKFSNKALDGEVIAARRVRVEIASADTAGMTAQVYDYQIEVTLGSGRVVTVLSGKLTLDSDL